MAPRRPRWPISWPLDDAAWAVVPTDRLRRVLLVGPGNVYLQNALSLLPNVELYGATGEDYASTTGLGQVRPHRLRRLPAGEPADQADPRLRAAADERSWATVAGTLQQPASAEPAPDEPLLRGVDLTRSTSPGPSGWTLPTWARSGDPRHGRGAAALQRRCAMACRPRSSRSTCARATCRSRWPGRSCVSNIAGELLGGTPAPRPDQARRARRAAAAARRARHAGDAARRDGRARSRPATPRAPASRSSARSAAGRLSGRADPGAPGAGWQRRDRRSRPLSPTPSPSGCRRLKLAARALSASPSTCSSAEESNIAPGDGARLTAARRRPGRRWRRRARRATSGGRCWSHCSRLASCWSSGSSTSATGRGASARLDRQPGRRRPLRRRSAR